MGPEGATPRCAHAAKPPAQRPGPPGGELDVLLHIELCYRYSGETEKSTQILKRCLAIIGETGQGIEARFAHMGYSGALFRLASHATLDSELLAELENIIVSSIG